MQPKQILIVEDEQAIADNINYALKSEGFFCHHQTLAANAIEYLQQYPVDLVVLDVGLPDLSGFEACKQIRQFSDVPIIFVTARSDEIDRVLGLEIGADDYLTKPFSPRELAARVKLRLRKTANISQPEIKRTVTSIFAVDPLKKQILLHGQALDLTFFEFGILRHLIDHPQQVFSRNQLMEAVWPEPETALERAVDTHVKSLRAKIRKNAPDISAIKTHRNLGYSFSIESCESA